MHVSRLLARALTHLRGKLVEPEQERGRDRGRDRGRQLEVSR
jgi:hypothetical protein